MTLTGFMKNDNNKRTKILYIILLIVLVILSVTSIANRMSKAKYQEAMSRLKELLSDPRTSFGKDPDESRSVANKRY